MARIVVIFIASLIPFVPFQAARGAEQAGQNKTMTHRHRQGSDAAKHDTRSEPEEQTDTQKFLKGKSNTLKGVDADDNF